MDVVKKLGRVVVEGIVKIYILEDKKKGVVVEFNCEIDFVVINDEFMVFVDRLV